MARKWRTKLWRRLTKRVLMARAVGQNEPEWDQNAQF